MAGERVVVVGAGPAGVRAAEVLAGPRLNVILVDENPTPGGRIYQQPPPGFARGYREIYGFEAGKAERLHATIQDLARRIDYRPSTLAWNVYDKVLYVISEDGHDRLPFDALVLAPGATDLVLPFAGWTRPGVYTLGGAQVALKHQGCAVGRRTVFVGTGPLLYLVAYQYLAAGAEVAAVLDTADPALARQQFLGLLSGATTFAKGLYYLWRLKAAKVPMLGGVRPLAVVGEGAVEALRCRDAEGQEFQVPADAVAMGFGLRSESQLADLAQCEFGYDAALRQWLPVVDEDGQSTVPGVYIAGDGRRIAGAGAAEVGGVLAAYAALIDFGYPVTLGTHRFWRAHAQNQSTFRRALEVAFPPPLDLAAAADDDTIVCRCEAVTAGAIRAAAHRQGASEINRAKALCRVGMGRCQGRYCAIAAQEVLAAALDVPAEAVGRLRAQAPVKPMPLAETAEA